MDGRTKAYRAEQAEIFRKCIKQWETRALEYMNKCTEQETELQQLREKVASLEETCGILRYAGDKERNRAAAAEQWLAEVMPTVKENHQKATDAYVEILNLEQALQSIYVNDSIGDCPFCGNRLNGVSHDPDTCIINLQQQLASAKAEYAKAQKEHEVLREIAEAANEYVAALRNKSTLNIGLHVQKLTIAVDALAKVVR